MEWTSAGGGVYTRNDSQVIINVENDGTALTEAGSSSVGAGEWFYDVTDGTLYVQLSDSSDPADSDVYITYRYFFSNIPINLPYDLSTGAEVFYDGRFNGFSPISAELDDENIGIAVESNTSITLENTDGYFDDIFDTLVWEYKAVKLYQYSSNLLVTQAKKVFDGIIEDKSFKTSQVGFKCKDFVYQLRQDVILENFSASDGNVPDAYLDTPKRRIYGQVEKARCVPIDAILDGYAMTGTVTISTTVTLSGTLNLTSGSAAVTGTGTAFPSELYDGATFYYTSTGNITGTLSGTAATDTITGSGTSFTTEIETNDTIAISGTTYTVIDVVSNTELTVAPLIAGTFSGVGSLTYSRVIENTVQSITNDTSLTLDANAPETASGQTVQSDDSAKIINGSGTAFLSEASPGDQINYTIGNVTYNVKIDSILSDTVLISDDVPEVAASSTAITNLPAIPYPLVNRDWHISGHKLRAASTTITEVLSNNRIVVASVADLFAGDRILVDSTEVATISSITGNTLILNQNLNTLPSVSDTVDKEPVSRAFVGTQEYIIERDFTVSNTSSDAILQFENDAEFNVAPVKLSTGSFTFTLNSRTVSLSGIDALNILKPRDWIKPSGVTYSTWYEILDVTQTTVTLRTAFAEATVNSSANYKNLNIINDDSVVVVNCVGKELSSTWLKTGAHAVEDLIQNDAGLIVNTASFTTAKADAPYIMSYILPAEIGGNTPKIRDAIDDINKTIFGSVYFNDSLEIAYSVVSPTKPADFTLIEQDDIIGDFTVTSKNEIVRKYRASYRPFYDTVINENTFRAYEYQNTFTTRAVGSTEDKDITIYLFNDEDAQVITQRYAFINSLSRSLVTFKTDLRTTNLVLNDVVKVNFRRLYKRLGNRDRIKLGLISKITKSNNTVTIEVNDLGNIYNRVANYTENTAAAFSSASDDEKALNGYYVDNTREVPDTTSEAEKDQNRFA